MGGVTSASPAYRLGRLARARDPFAPHLSALLASAGVAPTQLPNFPGAWHWGHGLPIGPGGLGMMLNDQLGDCTCAALGHAEQIWSFNASGSIHTIPDADVQLLYQQACGYQPGNPASDMGGVEQGVLSFVQKYGIPGVTGKIDGWGEVDPRIHWDVNRVIYDCGVCYLGFHVPASLLPPGQQPAAVWDITNGPDDYHILGGHAIIATGYDLDGVDIVSWGTQYRMTWRFWDAYVDEAYGIAAESWVNAKGTPSGLDLATIISTLSKIHWGP